MKKENIHIKKINNRYWLMSLISLMLVMTGCSNVLDSYKGDYVVMYTNVFKQEGAILEISDQGEILGEEFVKMQNVSYIDHNNDYVIMSGHRRNNNIIYSSTGDKKDLYFLNNPQYTGVTSVELYGDIIVSIMNGNVEDGIYKTLLVIQDINDTVLYQEILDMYPRDLYINDHVLYIVGNSKRANSSEWDSSIKKFDLKKNQIISGQTHNETYKYKNITILNDTLYLLTEDKTYDPRVISLLDKNTLEVIDEIEFDEAIIAIYSNNDNIYVLFNDRICKYNQDFELIDSQSIYTESESKIGYQLFFKNKLYLLMRYEDKKTLPNNNIEIGEIIKVDLNHLDDVKTTKFHVNDKNNVENIIFFPTSFFN